MTGTKFLSEVVKLDMLQKDKLNIIKAPTGSGKTYFALTAVPATLTDAVHKVVYLIDTINGKEQILKNYNARSIYHHWDVEVKDEALFFEADERIVIITYAKFGILLERYPDFHEHFEYIICDELHSLFKFATFGLQPNSHSIAKHGIERAVQNCHTKVIALSATPERIKREFDAPYCDVPVDDSDPALFSRFLPCFSPQNLASESTCLILRLCFAHGLSSVRLLQLADMFSQGAQRKAKSLKRICGLILLILHGKPQEGGGSILIQHKRALKQQPHLMLRDARLPKVTFFHDFFSHMKGRGINPLPQGSGSQLSQPCQQH